jgi:hypothetical protein
MKAGNDPVSLAEGEECVDAGSLLKVAKGIGR